MHSIAISNSNSQYNNLFASFKMFTVSLCGILHARFLWLQLKLAFFREMHKSCSYCPGSSDPADLCHLDQSLSAWQDENRGGATLSAGGPWCLYGPMLIKSSLAAFVLLHYTGWWSKCFSPLNAAGRDIRCPGGAVWWAGQAGLFCREVKLFFLSFFTLSTAIPM